MVPFPSAQSLGRSGGGTRQVYADSGTKRPVSGSITISSRGSLRRGGEWFAADIEVYHGIGNTKKYIGGPHPGRGAWASRGARRGVRDANRRCNEQSLRRSSGIRANHAKEVVAEGTFKAAPAAARLSEAVIFNGNPIPVTVRFSDSTGVPNLPDGSPLANPHGIAIKFHVPDGSETDMVINSLKFFPVSSGEDFRDMLLAVAESPAGAPKPTKLEQFAASHPNMPRALATVQTPDSFADEEYYGVNAFVLVNGKGNGTPSAI